MPNNIKLCQYTPDGAIPDKRAFAPALVAENISKYLNFDVCFISNKEDYDKTFEIIDNQKIFRIYHSYLYTKLFKKITRLDPYPFYKKAANIVNKEQCDIFCAHQIEFEINKFKSLLTKTIPVVVHAHSFRKFNKDRGIADKYIVVSEYSKNLLLQAGYPEDRIEVVYNGVNTELFGNYDNKELIKIKRQYNIPDDYLIISYVGRKQASKGFFTFLKVADYFLKTNKKLFFICAGPVTEGGKREKEYIEIQNLLNKLKSSKYFLDLPPLQHNKLKDIYNVTDIMLFPTYSGGEQHPLVAVEAIASKTILITSKIASLQEVIIDKQNGFLIDEPKKIDEIVNIIEEVSNNFKKYEFIKENARKTAIEKFDWKISAKKFEDILKGLL